MRFLIVLAVATGIAAAAPDDRLYRAHIAAAAANLRLQETGAARSWLDEAPVASRHWEWRYLDAASDLSRATLTGATVKPKRNAYRGRRRKGP